LNTVSLVVRLRSYRFPCAFPGRRVRLAKRMHSLVRFSKRTTEHRLPSAPTGGSPRGRLSKDLLCPVARSPAEFRLYCSSLLGILFSVRSRYLFAIGLEEYLAFPVDAWDVREEYPILATRGLTHVVLQPDTGLSPCVALRFRRLLGTGRTLIVSLHHMSRQRFGLGWPAFTRGY
jgi:hypothetical protein